MAFANTVVAARGRVRDSIETPDLLAAWLTSNAALREQGSAQAPTERVALGIPAGQVATFRAVRDAIRSLFRASIDGAPPGAADLDRLNRAASAAPSWPELTSTFGIVERTRDDAVTAALSGIARDAIAILGGPARSALRACQAPGCVQFFVKDHPRREWCGPACGHRARSARHYHRRRSVNAP